MNYISTNLNLVPSQHRAENVLDISLIYKVMYVGYVLNINIVVLEVLSLPIECVNAFLSHLTN